VIIYVIIHILEALKSGDPEFPFVFRFGTRRGV
jgi:hypothetical protein